MIIRDGRGQVHDLGPRHDAEVSLLNFVGGGMSYEGTGSGGSWRSMDWLFDYQPQRPGFSKRAFDNEHRAANLDHYRERERERARRYRANKRAA